MCDGAPAFRPVEVSRLDHLVARYTGLTLDFALSPVEC